MFWNLVGGVALALVVIGGAYQLATGRYVGVGRFAASYEASRRLARLSGLAGICGATVAALIWFAGSTGALPAK